MHTGTSPWSQAAAASIQSSIGSSLMDWELLEEGKQLAVPGADGCEPALAAPESAACSAAPAASK